VKSFFSIFVAIFLSLHPEAQTESRFNVPAETPTISSFPQGHAVYGIFEGRPPCQELAKQLHQTVSSECDHLKWRLILLRDSISGQPSTYEFTGSFFREVSRKGNWTFTKGSADNSDDIILTLDPDKPSMSFYFLNVDDNLLFILDDKKQLRKGNGYFSYTLNRVKLIHQSE
jgi:hypothetical protein